MRHRGGSTVIQARWWNVGSRSRNAKGNAESDEQGRNVPKGHTQATGIIQLLKKEEDMMKEAKPFVQGYVYAQRVECEEPCEGRLSRTVL